MEERLPQDTHFFYKRKNEGFTFIEMLIVIFIIGLIATSVVVSIRKSNKESSLRFARENLGAVLKQAQTMTFSGKTKLSGGEVPAGGYGVYIQTTTSYILFADDDGEGDYDSGEGIETINLPEKIEFFESGGGAFRRTRVIFRPPDGIMKIERLIGSWTQVADLTLYLRITDDPTKTARVYVNSVSGLIEVRE